MTALEPGQISRRTTEQGADGRRRIVVRIADHANVALSSADANLIAEGAHAALAQGVPFVCEFRANGPAAEEELAVTFAVGSAARQLTECSGRIPLIAILDGDAVAGPSLLLGLFDFVTVVTSSHAPPICFPSSAAMSAG